MLAEIESTPPRSIAQTIEAGLRDDILSGRYAAGQRLPSERDLVASTGGSRSSVREALKSLQSLGLIEIRRGGGARVLPLDQASLDVLKHMAFRDGRPDPALIAQWLDVQEILATGGIRLAIERADDASLQHAHATVVQLASGELDAEATEAAIVALFQLVGEASQNLVLRMIRYRLLELFNASFPGARRSLAIPPGTEATLRRVATALRKRDADTVEAAVRNVLRIRRDRILQHLQRGLSTT